MFLLVSDCSREGAETVVLEEIPKGVWYDEIL